LKQLEFKFKFVSESPTIIGIKFDLLANRLQVGRNLFQIFFTSIKVSLSLIKFFKGTTLGLLGFLDFML